MAITQVFAFAWFLVARPELLDRIDGYRIYGIVANLLFGLGWILLGISTMAHPPGAHERPSTALANERLTQ